MNYNHILKLQDDMVVAYADIIGFSNAVLHNEYTTEETEGFNINLKIIYDSILCKYSKEYQDDKGIKFIWISDSIFITSSIEQINQLLEELDYLTNQLYCAHFALRGGIALGKLHFENNLWGPAVINAVTYEKQAKYPCIVITKSDFERLTINEDRRRFFIPLRWNDFMYYNYFASFLGRCIKNNQNINSYLSVYTAVIESSYNGCVQKEHKDKWAFLADQLATAIMTYSSNIAEEYKNALKKGDRSKKRFLSVEQYLDRMKTVRAFIGGHN